MFNFVFPDFRQAAQLLGPCADDEGPEEAIRDRPRPELGLPLRPQPLVQLLDQVHLGAQLVGWPMNKEWGIFRRFKIKKS